VHSRPDDAVGAPFPEAHSDPDLAFKLAAAAWTVVGLEGFKMPFDLCLEAEAMGAKILAQYAVLGPYDFVNILDAPNSQVVSKVAIELGARGTLQTMTMAGMSLDDFIKGLAKK
jgi:uroporphyrinogen-III decarboxylase